MLRLRVGMKKDPSLRTSVGQTGKRERTESETGAPACVCVCARACEWCACVRAGPAGSWQSGWRCAKKAASCKVAHWVRIGRARQGRGGSSWARPSTANYFYTYPPRVLNSVIFSSLPLWRGFMTRKIIFKACFPPLFPPMGLTDARLGRRNSVGRVDHRCAVHLGTVSTEYCL